MKFPNGPILITGATGFIGSHLARRLVNEGGDVHVVHREGSAWTRIADIRDAVHAWKADLRDLDALERVCARVRPEYVFHLAGSTDVRFVDAALRSVHESVEVNVLGSLNVLVAVSRAGSAIRLVRLGGLEEYGRGPAPYSERQREAPVSPYSASQVAVTHYFQMLQPALPFAVVTLRPALIYGPGQSERFLIPALIRHCLSGQDFQLTSGEQTRDLIYIDDVVDALCRAAVADAVRGDVINIGSGEARRIVDVARRVMTLCGADIELHIGAAPARTTEIDTLVCDPARARAHLGWSVTTDLDSGLASTIEWTRASIVNR